MTLLEPVRADLTDGGADSTVVGGRYQPLELLGTGGSAVVHRALDLRLGRTVALKRVRPDRDTALHRLRLLDEGRVLSQVTHPGFARVLDASWDGPEPPYVVLELVDGPDLAAVLEAGALAPDAVAQLGCDVAEALAHLHDRRIAHRDVKPANLLVDRAGRTRVCDLGIATPVGDVDPHGRDGHTVGSVAYLAPEQVRGEPVTDRTDIYALGLVLLEALTGRREFTATPDTTVDVVAWERVHRGPTIPTSLPAGWPALLDEMTRHDPAQRPDARGTVARLRLLATTRIGAPRRPAPASLEATGLMPSVAPALVETVA